MMNIIALFKNILRRSLSKKGNWVTFLLLPILGIFAAMAFNNNGTSATKVGVYNLNNSYLAEDMIKSIGKNENFQLFKVENQDYKLLLKDKKLDCVLVIPKDFDKQILNGKVKDLQIYSQQGKEVTVWIENYVNFYVDNLIGISNVVNGDNQKFKSIYDEYKKSNLKLTTKQVNDATKSKGTTKQSIGFLLILMLMASKVTTDAILNDKYCRTFFRIFCSPVSKMQYVMANFISNMVVFILQVFVILFVSIGIFKLNFYMDIPTLIVLFLIFGTAAIAFGVVIAAFSKSTAQASQLQNIFIVPTSMLAGCFWPMEIMPKFFQKLSLIFPQAWVLKAVDELQYGKAIYDIKLHLLVILAFALVMFFIGICRFKNDDDIKNVV